MSLSFLFKRTRLPSNATKSTTSNPMTGRKRKRSVCFLNPSIQNESSFVFEDDYTGQELVAEEEEPTAAYFYSDRLQTPEEHRMFCESQELVTTNYHSASGSRTLSEFEFLLVLLYYNIEKATNVQLLRMWDYLTNILETKPDGDSAKFPTITIALGESVSEFFSTMNSNSTTSSATDCNEVTELVLDTDSIEKLRDLLKESEWRFHGKQIGYDSDSESVRSAFSVGSDSGDSNDSLFENFDLSELAMEQPDKHVHSGYDPTDFMSMSDGCLHVNFSRFPASPRSMRRESSVSVEPQMASQQWNSMDALQPVMSMASSVMESLETSRKFLKTYSTIPQFG